MKEIVRFSCVLSLALALVFGLNYWAFSFVKESIREYSLLKAYLVNGVITIGIYSLLVLLKEKFTGSLGFFFLGGSLFKFIVFFLLFQPEYKADGDVTRLEFATFFIPYGLCLLIEVLSLLKLLKD